MFQSIILDPNDRRSGDRREHEHEHDAAERMPWQARAIGFIGVPGAALLLVLYFLVLPIVEAMPRLESKMDQHIKAMESEQYERAEEKRDRRQRDVRMEKYMEIMCVNLARTADAKLLCQRVNNGH